MIRRAAVLAVFAALALGCSNAGEQRLLTIGDPGVVKGLVFFDVNGDRAVNTGDDSVKNVTVRLITLSGHDTIASGTTAASGQFRINAVPVGTYKVVLDVTPLSDTAVVEIQDSAQVTILPKDSSSVLIGISYPHVSIRAARTPALVPLGRKVFVEGIVLNSQGSFTDKTIHFQDTSAAIRASRVFTTAAAPGDTVRIRGTVAADTTGLRKLDVVTVYIINQSFAPAPVTVTTAQAKTAVSGARDAQLLRLASVTVADTVASNLGLILQVTDASGGMDVLLDVSWLTTARPPGFPYVPGKKFDIVGLAVPSGTPGIWLLKPRSQFDLVVVP